MTRRFAGGWLLLGMTALAACNGWPRAPELEAARHKPEYYATYAATPGEQVQTVTFDNRRWLVSPARAWLRGVKLQAVGTAGRTTVYAEQGQRAPYSVLYAADASGNLHRVLPIE